MNQESEHVTVPTAAALLGVGQNTIRRWADKGFLKVWRDPKNRLHPRAFLRSEIEDLAARRPQ